MLQNKDYCRYGKGKYPDFFARKFKFNVFEKTAQSIHKFFHGIIPL